MQGIIIAVTMVAALAFGGSYLADAIATDMAPLTATIAGA